VSCFKKSKVVIKLFLYQIYLYSINITMLTTTFSNLCNVNKHIKKMMTEKMLMIMTMVEESEMKYDHVMFYCVI